ncbi:hypothetical protein BGC30_14235 [Novacetimonas hansenii]|nr:hypothetical protein BGC30_14235 [Novacetimonas hansenii]
MILGYIDPDCERCGWQFGLGSRNWMHHLFHVLSGKDKAGPVRRLAQAIQKSKGSTGQGACDVTGPPFIFSAGIVHIRMGSYQFQTIGRTGPHQIAPLSGRQTEWPLLPACPTGSVTP